MKPHPRIRKTVKWGGAVVTVLLLVLWVGSAWQALYINVGNIVVGTHRGAIDVMKRWPRPQYLPVAPPNMSGLKFEPFDFTKSTRPPTSPRQPASPLATGSPAAQPSQSFVRWFYIKWEPYWQVTIPLWAPFALSLLITVWAWRLDALWARRPGRCLACNYDRTGLAAGAVCPECGAGPCRGQGKRGRGESG